MSRVEICTFRGIRRYVMEKVWEKIREAEERGEMVTHEDFGKFVREAWKEAKAEYAKVCRLA